MRRPYDAIVWWELRRIPFNAILLVTGVCSFALILGIGSLLQTPGDDWIEPLGIVIGGILYVVGANLCYTLGWATELLWSRGDTTKTEAARSIVYRRGVILSVVITAAPGVLVPLAWAIFGFH
jgi:hypothetical protein